LNNPNNPLNKKRDEATARESVMIKSGAPPIGSGVAGALNHANNAAKPLLRKKTTIKKIEFIDSDDE